MPNAPVIYQPTRYEILIAPSRDVNRALADELIRLAAGRRSYDPLSLVSKLISGITSNVNPEEKGHGPTKLPTYEIRPIRDIYSHYKYTDLASHPAVILIPYQVSLMLFFELYSMNMPMFVPSPKLLTQWHLEYISPTERTNLGLCLWSPRTPFCSSSTSIVHFNLSIRS